MGPYRAASPPAAAATTTRGAGGRRSTAPKSPTQKSALRRAEGHGGRRGGAPRRAAPPAARARQPEPGSGAGGGRRAEPRGPGTYHGAQVLPYYTNIPDKRGSAEGYGLRAAACACAAAGGKAGKRRPEGPAMFRAVSRRAGGAAGRCWQGRRSGPPPPAGVGELSACRGEPP